MHLKRHTKNELMKKLLLIALVTSFVFGECNKNENPAPPPASNFQPTKAGSVWNFRNTNLLTAATSNFSLTALAKDSTLSGRVYRVFANSSGPNEYFANLAGEYFQFGRFEGIASPVDLLYLKPELPVGGTWQEVKTITVSNVPVTVTFNYRLAEKGISFVVGANTFTKVTRVSLELNAVGLPITSQSINFYYADGIGRIFSKVKLVVPLAGINNDSETALTSYTLAP
ncbi:MAG: hypothetical protein EAY75_11175 [Bacteroidetes bacterium]|nr:MAG: hypothetical protein EAY75_11175 [Bacteroidota bacterium]